jgi:sugar/nucleoside kinase (ribokinase family)
MGPKILVIKKGEHGALLFADDIIFSAPAYPLEDIRDPTGAGDAFMGGFAGYLAQRSTIDVEALKTAVIYGSAMASFVVERFGPERLYDLAPTEIYQRLDAFRDLSTIPMYPDGHGLMMDASP